MTSDDDPAVAMANLRRRLRWRARLDVLLVAVVAGVAALLAPDNHLALMLAISTLSIGILLIIIRRGEDAIALSRADRWRSEAVEGRGISLAEWQKGRELAGWDVRRQSAPAARPAVAESDSHSLIL